MKKILVIPALAATMSLAVVSCIDNNYNLNNINSESDIKVEITQNVPDVNAGEFFNSVSGLTNEQGVATANTAKTQTVTSQPIASSDLSQKTSITFSAPTEISLESLFTQSLITEEMLKALDNPVVKLEVSVSGCGSADITYSGKLNGVPFSVTLPGSGDYVISLSKKALTGLSSTGQINSVVDNFSNIFNDLPKVIKVTDITVQASQPKSGLRTDDKTPSFSMSASATLPLQFTAGSSFNIKRELTLSGFGEIDWKQYQNAKKIKIDFELTHNLPFSLDEVNVFNPTGITTKCPQIKAVTTLQTGTIELAFANGLPKTIDKLGFDVKITATGDPVSDQMLLKITIKKVAVTTTLF